MKISSCMKDGYFVYSFHGGTHDEQKRMTEILIYERQQLVRIITRMEDEKRLVELYFTPTEEERMEEDVRLEKEMLARDSGGFRLPNEKSWLYTKDGNYE